MAAGLKNARILLVDDSEVTLDVLERNLSSLGYSVAKAISAREAMEKLAGSGFDLVVTDLRMPGMSGLDLVKHVRESLPDTAVMMITGYATIEGAVEAVKTGAEEYLAKPFTDEELKCAVERALAKLAAQRSARVQSPKGRFGLVGESEPFRRALASVHRLAKERGALLIVGEPGSGRGAIALGVIHMLHGPGARVLAVDCARAGCVAMDSASHLAGGSALYFKSLDWAEPAVQAWILELLSAQALVEGSLIFSSGPTLPLLVECGLFRGDLYRALAARAASLPPLRERGDDVLLLADHFLAGLATRLGKSPPSLDLSASKALKAYPWPGNVEELRAAILGAYTRAPSETLDVRDLPAAVRGSVPPAGFFKTLAESEAEHILDALALARGRKGRAAELLGIDRKTLREKLRAVGQGGARSKE